MSQTEDWNENYIDEKLLEDLQRQPHITIKLAQNALLVAESLRDNYFKNTAQFVKHLRGAMLQAARGERKDRILGA